MPSYLATVHWSHCHIVKRNQLNRVKLETISHRDINSFWPNDATWRHKIWSGLFKVMVCRLLGHYLKQCWFIVNWTLRNKLRYWIFCKIAPIPSRHWLLSRPCRGHRRNDTHIYRVLFCYTVRCRYNAINFLPNPHNRYPIARPWGCLLWF